MEQTQRGINRLQGTAQQLPPIVSVGQLSGEEAITRSLLYAGLIQATNLNARACSAVNDLNLEWQQEIMRKWYELRGNEFGLDSEFMKLQALEL